MGCRRCLRISIERCPVVVLLACVIGGCNAGSGIANCNVAPTNTATRDPSTLSKETSKGTGSVYSFCKSLCFLKWTGKCSAGGYERAGCLGFYTNSKHGDSRYVRCAEQSQSKKCHAEVKPKGPTSGHCPTDVDLSPDGPLCSSVTYPQGMLDVDSSTVKASVEEYADHGPDKCPIRAPCWRGKHTVCLKENTCKCVDKWNHCAYEGKKKCPKGSYNPGGRGPSDYNSEDKWWVEHCSATCELCKSDEILFPRKTAPGCDGNPGSTTKAIDIKTASVKINGNLVMTVPDPAKFGGDQAAQDAVSAGIAAAHDVPPSSVVIEVSVTTRRLAPESSERLLAAGSVNVKYTITVPESETAAKKEAVKQKAQTLTIAQLTKDIETKVQAEKGTSYAISVTKKLTPVVKLVAKKEMEQDTSEARPGSRLLCLFTIVAPMLVASL